MQRLSKSAGVAVTFVAVLAACTPMREPGSFEPMEAPKIGTLESAYDRTRWR